MSRSRRHTPIIGNAAGGDSEKEDKARANRAARAKARSDQRLTEEPVQVRDVSNVATFQKDGKHYWGAATAKSMRK